MHYAGVSLLSYSWQPVAYLGFQKGEGEAPRWWGAGRGLCPFPRKHIGPQNNNFWCIFMRFLISYTCNNRVQNPFSVPYDLLRVFEDDNTTNCCTSMKPKISGNINFRKNFIVYLYDHQFLDSGLPVYTHICIMTLYNVYVKDVTPWPVIRAEWRCCDLDVSTCG